MNGSAGLALEGISSVFASIEKNLESIVLSLLPAVEFYVHSNKHSRSSFPRTVQAYAFIDQPTHARRPACHQLSNTLLIDRNGEVRPSTRTIPRQQYSNVSFPDHLHEERAAITAAPKNGKCDFPCAISEKDCLLMLVLLVVAFSRMPYSMCPDRVYPKRVG